MADKTQIGRYKHPCPVGLVGWCRKLLLHPQFKYLIEEFHTNHVTSTGSPCPHGNEIHGEVTCIDVMHPKHSYHHVVIRANFVVGLIEADFLVYDFAAVERWVSGHYDKA